jgi:hypothetical protein
MQTTTAGANNSLPFLYHVIDYDDNSNPANANELLEYENCKVDRLDKIVSRTFSPRFASAAYSGAFTSYANSDPNTWIDTGSPGVLYYGMKFCLNSPSWVAGSTYSGALKIISRVHLECKDVR